MDGSGKGILRGFLGEIEVAEHANERGQDAARVGPVERVDPLARCVPQFMH